MITIVDYGSGNINALANNLKLLSHDFIVATNPSDLKKAKKLIIPGVDAFDNAIIKLTKSGMRDKLVNMVLEKAIPTLGICVGMHIMTQCSEEGTNSGLGFFQNSKTVKFRSEKFNSPYVLPHMGWNAVKKHSKTTLMNHQLDERGFYFLHSYHVIVEPEDVLCSSFYGYDFSSGIIKDNIVGVQFHPEKSHDNGLALINNFCSDFQC